MIRVSAEGPTGVPAAGSVALGSALVPVPARIGEAYQSWGEVVGDPGTVNIHAPAPVPGKDTEQVALAIQGVGAGGMGLPSSTTQYWRPGIYYQPKLASRFHGALESDNQLPVPAENPLKHGKMATTRMAVPTTLGQNPVSWPITLPNYNARF